MITDPGAGLCRPWGFKPKVMKMREMLGMMALAVCLVAGCGKQPEPEPPTPPDEKQPKELTPTSGDLSPSDVPNYDKIYMTSEFYKKERGWTVTSTFYDPL